MAPIHAVGEVEEAFRNLKGDLGHLADLTPGRPTDRGAWIRQLLGVLPAGESEGTAGADGAGSDSEIGAGEAGSDADGGRACTHERRTRFGDVAIHGAFGGPTVTDGSVAVGLAGTTPYKDHDPSG